jgi:uncharacterized protein involved in oxidation of intracellular sulfur
MSKDKRQRALIILNDPPYGSERSYNGLRLAGALAKDGLVDLRVFLMGDSVACARGGQDTPKGYYNLERMLRLVTNHDGEVGACGSCMDARGLADAALTHGVRRSSLEELASWTSWADKVIVF